MQRASSFNPCTNDHPQIILNLKRKMRKVNCTVKVLQSSVQSYKWYIDFDYSIIG